MEIGKPLGVVSAGLGARDTLRLEAGMPLYGHELSEEIDPFKAGLGFACHLVGYNFPGRDALLRIQNQPPKLVRIGLEMAGKRAARPGCAIMAGDTKAGEVTSGSYSPTLGKAIAMGYVAPEFAKPGLDMHIDIRGSREAARVVDLPFYSRKKKGNQK
jgi:aminomethyltransferase